MTRILMASPELANVAMVGGIAEYLWGLAGALLRQGHDVRVALPDYAFIRKQSELSTTVVQPRMTVALGPGNSTVTSVTRLDIVWPAHEELTLPVYLLGGHPHFDTVTQAQHLYEWPNHEPWVVFCKAIIEWLQRDPWKPEVIHCQDAHCALLPVYIQDMRTHHPGNPLTSARTVLTLHNLLNQGKAPPDLVTYAGLHPGWFNMEGFEFYGYTNSLKAGILWADQVNTVSQTYANEICSSHHYGFGLEGVLQRVALQGKLTGIVNGIDTERWALDGLAYDGSNKDLAHLTQTKEACRASLFRAWDVEPSSDPILIFRSRWDTQKGVLLLAACIEELLPLTRCVFVTWGTPGLTPELKQAWEKLQRMAQTYPQQLILNPKGLLDITETASHYTLGDFVLMPSTYEPCGLVQMECLRYGTLPIVRHTGGLVDTISEYPHDNLPSPNGFTYREQQPHALLAAVRRAVQIYHDPELLPKYRHNALLQQNQWDSRVAAYEALYTG